MSEQETYSELLLNVNIAIQCSSADTMSLLDRKPPTKAVLLSYCQIKHSENASAAICKCGVQIFYAPQLFAALLARPIMKLVKIFAFSTRTPAQS